MTEKLEPGMAALMQQMRAKAKPITQEEFDELEREYERDYGDFSSSGAYTTWNPTERAGHKPKPKLLRPEINKQYPTWDDYLVEENFGQDWVILGAGAGALQHAKDLDGKIVYGINWITRWFQPTFLQAVDNGVFREEIRTPRGRKAIGKTQFVASRYIAYEVFGDDKDLHRDFLLMDYIHPGTRRGMDQMQFAETYKDNMSWCPNSLYWALNVAHWFKPRAIALVGFDFGGPHIFGDGRSAGAVADYGFKGSKSKGDMQDRLRFMRDAMEERGHRISHVRPTKLEVFNQVDSIQEAFA